MYLNRAIESERRGEKSLKPSGFATMFGDKPDPYEALEYFHQAAGYYALAHDYGKSAECFLRSAELGRTTDFKMAASMFEKTDNPQGVESCYRQAIDKSEMTGNIKKTAELYAELAAITNDLDHYKKSLELNFSPVVCKKLAGLLLKDDIPSAKMYYKKILKLEKMDIVAETCYLLICLYDDDILKVKKYLKKFNGNSVVEAVLRRMTCSADTALPGSRIASITYLIEIIEKEIIQSAGPLDFT